MSTIKSDSIQPTSTSNNFILRTGVGDVERMRISPAGGVTFSSAVGMTSTLDVSGGLSASALYASTGSTFGSTLYVGGGVTFAQGSDYSGAARFSGGLSASALYASRGSTFGSTLYVGGGVTLSSTLNVGDFTTGNVSPRSVLHRTDPSVVGRIVSIYIGQGTTTAYSSTPLDAGVWEVHLRLHENDNGDEDPIAEYHTIVTVPASNYLTWKLTHIKPTTLAVTGLQYRLQSTASSVVNTNVSPAWTDIPMIDTEYNSSSLSTGSVTNGFLMGMVGSQSQLFQSANIDFCTGYAKRIA